MKSISNFSTHNIFSKKAKSILSTNTSRAFYTLGLYDTYLKCLIYRKDHLHRMINKLDSTKLGYDDLIGQNTLIYLQLQLRRSLNLLLACFDSIKNKNSLSLVLNVRSHFEVAGSLGYLKSLLEKYYNHEKQKADIYNILCKLLLGKRMNELKSPFESINVLTMIDEADKVFNKMAHNKIGTFRDSYEWLSEFCHPNSYGLIMNYQKLKSRIAGFSPNKLKLIQNFKNLDYINISIPLFINFYDDIFTLIKNNEILPDINEGIDIDALNLDRIN